MKHQSPLTSHQSFRACLAVICLAFISLSSGASALEIPNKHVKVTIEAPTGISNFTGVTKGDDFYSLVNQIGQHQNLM